MKKLRSIVAAVAVSLGLSTVVGSSVASAGTVTAPGLSWPTAIAVAPNGQLIIADQNNNRVVAINPDGSGETTLASGLNKPRGVAVDGTGAIFVTNTFGGQILKMDADGSNQVTIAEGLSYPLSIACDGQGHLFVVINDGHLLRLNNDGTDQQSFGPAFPFPISVAVDASGNVYEGDATQHFITKMSPDGTTTRTIDFGNGNGFGVATDAAGNVLVASQGANKVYRVQVDGTITTMGNSMNGPTGVAVDSDGQVYVVDLGGFLHVITPQEAAATPPGAPTDVSATSGGDRKSVISWTAPVSNGGLPISNYTATDSQGHSCSTSTLSCTISNILPGNDTVTVTATNDAGTSPSSEAASFSVVGPAGQPQNFLVTLVGDPASGNVVLTWSPPTETYGQAITGYKITVLSFAHYEETNYEVSGDARQATLTLPSWYSLIAIVAQTSNGYGNRNQSYIYVGAPPSITNLPSSAAPGGSFTPTIESDRFWPALSVTSETPAVCALSDGAVSFVGAGTCTLIAHVTDGLRLSGNGSPQSFTVATEPSAPTGLAFELGNSNATFRWTAPHSTGGTAITGYTVSSSQGSHSCSTFGALKCTISGLTPGTRYTFSVVAQNSRGASVPSTSVSAIAVKTTAISSFRFENATLTGPLKALVRAMARDIATHGYKKVSLFGYSNNGADSALSVARARSVQSFLSLHLTALKVRGVTITIAGGQSTTKFTAAHGTDHSGNRCVVASLS